MKGVKVIGSKHCTKCGERKSLAQFYRRYEKHQSECKDCARARRPQVPKKYRDTKTRRECGKCHEVKVLDDFQRQTAGTQGRKRMCRECVAERAAEYRQRPGYSERRAVLARIWRAKRREDVDLVRKTMSNSPPDLRSEEERLAFVRGFFRGRSVQDQESSLITENQDLVFRIASEVHDPTHADQGSCYEDCVGYAYEGILDAARRYRPNNSAGASFRTFAGTRIRGAILDGLRRRGARWNISGRNGERVSFAPYTGKSEDGTSKNLVEVLPDGATPDVQVRDTEAKIDSEDMFSRIEREIDAKHAYVVRRCYDGITLSKIGEELGVTESRASQMRTRVREWASSIGLS